MLPRSLRLLALLTCCLTPAVACLNDSGTVEYEQEFQRQYNQPVEPAASEEPAVPMGIGMILPGLLLLGASLAVVGLVRRNG